MQHCIIAIPELRQAIATKTCFMSYSGSFARTNT
jgi:hypothetical protein